MNPEIKTKFFWGVSIISLVKSPFSIQSVIERPKIMRYIADFHDKEQAKNDQNTQLRILIVF